MQTMTAQAPSPELFTDSEESTSAIFTQLYKLARSVIKSYETDLIKHDRKQLETGENKNRPFLFGARRSGTGLTHLLPDLETYEAQGLSINNKYLFGYIDSRETQKRILYGLAAGATYPENEIFYYYDGKKLKEISQQKANEIHRDHITHILRAHHVKQSAIRTQYN